MDQEQILVAQYTEVCRSYHGISEFRGKLLALLPIVSGAGISLLISKNYSLDSSHLFAVGIFGGWTVATQLYDMASGTFTSAVWAGRVGEW